jgi:hypothetical protein
MARLVGRVSRACQFIVWAGMFGDWCAGRGRQPPHPATVVGVDSDSVGRCPMHSWDRAVRRSGGRRETRGIAGQPAAAAELEPADDGDLSADVELYPLEDLEPWRPDS